MLPSQFWIQNHCGRLADTRSVKWTGSKSGLQRISLDIWMAPPITLVNSILKFPGCPLKTITNKVGMQSGLPTRKIFNLASLKTILPLMNGSLCTKILLTTNTSRSITLQLQKMLLLIVLPRHQHNSFKTAMNTTFTIWVNGLNNSPLTPTAPQPDMFYPFFRTAIPKNLTGPIKYGPSQIPLSTQITSLTGQPRVNWSGQARGRFIRLETISSWNRTRLSGSLRTIPLVWPSI